MYKLRLGVATSSEGIACAKCAGMPPATLQRAEEVKENIKSRKPIQSGQMRRNCILDNPKHKQLLQLFLKTEDWSTDRDADKLKKLIDSM